MELFRSILEIAFPAVISLYIIYNYFALKAAAEALYLENAIREAQFDILFEEVNKLREKIYE